MSGTYKNFWSLNTDEVVVAGKLRDFFKKDVEVMMPLNAQLKDIDLMAVNLQNRRVATIQVKGSRAYEPSKSERDDFGDGSAGWFFLDKGKIEKSTADFFVFLVYVIVKNEKQGRRYFEPHFITVKTDRFNELCKQYKVLHTRYSFYIWISPSTKTAFDFRDEKARGRMDLSAYLDDQGLEQIKKELTS